MPVGLGGLGRGAGAARGTRIRGGISPPQGPAGVRAAGPTPPAISTRSQDASGSLVSIA